MRVHRVLACPFGNSFARGEYQDSMAYDILQDFYLKGVVLYINDTAIHGASVTLFWTS
jgi:hypothetical protein